MPDSINMRGEPMAPDDRMTSRAARCKVASRHEIQILGDFASGETSLGGNGALYNFKTADKFVSKPGDQWQTAEATIIGDKITVALNGVKIHNNVECRKGTGGQLDNNVYQPGPIFLQGDHGTVSFRNLRIKELK